MQQWRDAGWAQRVALLALLVLPAMVVATPVNLLPFGCLLLLSSVLGIGTLWRRPLPWPLLAPLLLLTVLQVGLGVLSLWQADVPLRELDNLVRFLVVPWTACWVYALRLPQRLLWSGAVVGLLASLLVAMLQVLGGAVRAEAWTNAIVLADVAVVLLVLVICCRPPARLLTVLLAVLATALLVMLTGSRGVWPAMAMVLLLAVLSGDRGSWRRRFAVLAVAATLLAGALVASPDLREQVRLDELAQDWQRLQRGDVDSSAGARYERLHVAWQAFKAQPWQGVGLGQFDTAMQRLPVCRQASEDLHRCHLEHAHNDLAEWAATRGIPGIIGLLAVYGIPLLLFARLWWQAGRPQQGPALAGIGVVVVYVVCGLTQSMFAHQITAGLYACLVGVLAGLGQLARQDRLQEQAANGSLSAASWPGR
ncbi:hypothetical protein ABB30_08380 [Stenotrophomonas ginsengisoli]|uniref:O-antigen ligase-related domain-containing protein n=2 Tax=Stenotrophomonas ginsengisoli TaxID=336566 RepID=A0A0R0DF84_9GAMM|nr:hypothetical protein ABB30_08380 [Stenotrophomonas ginsengisoli]